jgi:hypothetical protein
MTIYFWPENGATMVGDANSGPYVRSAEYSALLSRLERAEARLSAAEAVVEAARPYVPEPGVYNTSHAIQEKIRATLAAYDTAAKAKGAGE